MVSCVQLEDQFKPFFVFPTYDNNVIYNPGKMLNFLIKWIEFSTWTAKFPTISYVFLYSVEQNFSPNNYDKISWEWGFPIPHFSRHEAWSLLMKVKNVIIIFVTKVKYDKVKVVKQISPHHRVLDIFSTALQNEKQLICFFQILLVQRIYA